MKLLQNKKNNAFCCVVLIIFLAGCVSNRLAEIETLLGLRSPAVAQVIDPAVQKQLDQLYSEGAAALSQGNLKEAISLWRKFISLSPLHQKQTRKVRGYITLLEREDARDFAKQAAASEQAAAFIRTDKRHIAIMPFRNLSISNSFGPKKPFNRAILAMITVDLAQVQVLKILERDKLKYLMQEFHLATSGLVDPATANRVARILGAGTVITGTVRNEDSLEQYDEGLYKINTAVADVETRLIIGAQEAEGFRSRFFKVEKEIVYEILQTLKVKDIPESVGKIHTKNWDAYAQFAIGLKMLEEDRFAEAQNAFIRALRHDPKFELAREAFLNTPETKKTMQQITAEVEMKLE